VQSIYGMLAAIQGTQERHSNRFMEIAEKLDSVDHTVAAVERRLEGQDARFDAHDARFDAHDGRFDALEGKIDTVLELLPRITSPSVVGWNIQRTTELEQI
jgi:hypothetical protein